MTPAGLREALDSLAVPAEHAAVLERLLQFAGHRAADAAQEFFAALLAAREAGASDPAAVALAAVRRWLRRERLEAAMLEPIMLSDEAGREHERPDVLPMPLPPRQVRRQIRWGRRPGAESAEPRPDPLRAAIHHLPMAERNAINQVFLRPARGRRSKELLTLAQRGIARLREVLLREHVAAKML